MSTEEEDVFQRLLHKQAELERMRRAIQELQSLDDVRPAPPPDHQLLCSRSRLPPCRRPPARLRPSLRHRRATEWWTLVCVSSYAWCTV